MALRVIKTRKERDAWLRSQDEVIAEHLAQALRSGELQSARGFGKPLAEGDGWAETPVELRMPFKILKNAGAYPPEIELFHRRAALRKGVDQCVDERERVVLNRQLSELEQLIALRLEGLSRNGRL